MLQTALGSSDFAVVGEFLRPLVTGSWNRFAGADTAEIIHHFDHLGDVTGRAAPILQHGALTLDPAARQVRVGGETVDPPPREFALLHLLLENAGRVVPRSQIEQSLYGWSEEPDSNALDVHIHHLRKKLGNELIRTLRGVGYMIPKP